MPDNLDREYLDYIRERDARRDAEARAAEERYLAAAGSDFERKAAYGEKQDNRAYSVKKQELALKRKELLEVGIPQAKVDKWYKEAQVALARDTLIEDRRQFDLSFGEGQRQFNTTTGVNLLGMGAALTGPAKVFEAQDLARGIQSSGELTSWIKGLRDGGDASIAGGAYAATPDAMNLSGLIDNLTGTGTGAGNQATADANLAAIKAIGMTPGKLKPGSLEKLQPGEQGALASGLGKAGYEVPDWLNQYKQNTTLAFDWAA